MKRLESTIEIPPSEKTFANGLLIELVQALRSSQRGDLIGLTAGDPSVAEDLDRWSRLTRNAVVGTTAESGGTRWVIRHGEVPPEEAARRIGSRLWLYTNFDCNLACTYCCVRSSPRRPRRELGLEKIRRIAQEATLLGVEEIFLTGGEPFLLPDVAEIIAVCSRAAETTVLTNGMLLKGSKLQALRALSPERVTFQVSVDSPDPELHDRNRGAGSWQRAIEGIARVRELGFRVRYAATVENDHEARRFERFLDESKVVSVDRVIRRIALRGFAEDGVALSRADIVPEVTITDQGVHYHPVGADDDDFLLTPDSLPLAGAIDAVKRKFSEESAHRTSMASIFNCA